MAEIEYGWALKILQEGLLMERQTCLLHYTLSQALGGSKWASLAYLETLAKSIQPGSNNLVLEHMAIIYYLKKDQVESQAEWKTMNQPKAWS